MLASPFEAGFEPVVRIEPESAINGCSEWRVGARAGVLRISSNDDRSWEFDLEGRMLALQVCGESRRATLDLRLWGNEIVRDGANRRLRKLPALVDGLDRISAVYEIVRELFVRSSPKNCTFERGGDDHADAATWVEGALAAASRWDHASLSDDRDRLQSIYKPISVLPPDQYAALVVQISEGCSWDRCKFCSLYTDIPYRERSVAEVESHLETLMLHLGQSIRRYSRVFLGQANALLRDTEELLEIFAAIRERLPLAPEELSPGDRRSWMSEQAASMTGVHAFVDAFHREKTVEEWQALREAGLRRIYLGLESGDEDLVRKLGKPLKMDTAIRMAERLHAAGLRMGVILLTGIGEMNTEDRHRNATVTTIGKMKLRAGDQVYLSPLIHPSGAKLIGVNDGSVVQAGAALTRMKEALRPILPRGVPMARYDLPRLQERVERI